MYLAAVFKNSDVLVSKVLNDGLVLLVNHVIILKGAVLAVKGAEETGVSADEERHILTACILDCESNTQHAARKRILCRKLKIIGIMCLCAVI